MHTPQKEIPSKFLPTNQTPHKAKKPTQTQPLSINRIGEQIQILNITIIYPKDKLKMAFLPQHSQSQDPQRPTLAHINLIAPVQPQLVKHS